MTDDASLAPALAHPVAIACAARTNVLVRTHPAPALAPYRSPMPGLASATRQRRWLANARRYPGVACPRGLATRQLRSLGGPPRAYHKSTPVPPPRQE